MTKIEWADDTINPITGCTPITEGCKNCYAASIAKRFWGNRPFSDIRLHPDRLSQFSMGKPHRRKFIGSMCDIFHPQVNEKFIGRIIGHIAASYFHTFITLTKRPLRAEQFCHAIAHYPKGNESKRPEPGLPPNHWFGISISNQANANIMIPILLKIPARVRAVSVEPMLGPIDLNQNYNNGKWFGDMVHWVICGAETGNKARPMKLEWAIDLKNQCKEAGIPFFFKKASKGDFVPDELLVREFPQTERR